MEPKNTHKISEFKTKLINQFMRYDSEFNLILPKTHTDTISTI